MKFKNLETGKIIEVSIDDKDKINRFKGYPDKFEIIEEKVLVEKKETKKEEDKKMSK